MRCWLSIGLLWVATSGCTGVIGDARSIAEDHVDPSAFRPEAQPAPPPPGVDSTCDPAALIPPEHRARRLSQREYLNTIRELAGATSLGSIRHAADASSARFDNAIESLSVSEVLVEDYEANATALGQILGEEHGADLESCGTEASCVHALLEPIGRRVIRRPPSQQQLERWGDIYIEELGLGESPESASALLFSVLLQSPQFLYRLDLPEGDSDVLEVDGWDLASRLSYFLWQSMPDEALLDAAASGALTTEEGLEAEVRRMIADSRTSLMVGDFHRQWLETGRLFDPDRAERKDTERFPQWSESLREAMQQEVVRFSARVFESGSATLEELLTSRNTFVNGELAEIYGVEDVSEWTAVELPSDQRAGLLTMPAFVAGHAGPSDPAAIHTGLFVWNQLLCGTSVGDPSDLGISPELAELDPSEQLTNRQRWERDTGRAPCSSCHAHINEIGFAFEAFDAIGRFRTTDNGLPVDASGRISGSDVDGELSGPTELASRLAQSHRVQRCVSVPWYAFAHGRSPSDEDDAAIACIADTFEQSGGDLRELLVAITTSESFRTMRRAMEEDDE